MEQLKRIVEQMLYQLKQGVVGQSSAHVIEMIGLLEQLKSHLLAKVLQPTAGSSSLPAAQMAPPYPQIAPPPHPQMAPPPHPHPQMALPPPPPEIFVPLTPMVNWHSKELQCLCDHKVIEIKFPHFLSLKEGSPVDSFIHSSVIVPTQVTLTSQLLAITCPGMLSFTSLLGTGMDLFWAQIGKSIPEGATISLSYQWLKSGPKYMLVILIDRENVGARLRPYGVGGRVRRA